MARRQQCRYCLAPASDFCGFFDNAELSAAGFVARYLAEMAEHGYPQAPLEQMAYSPG